MTHCRPLDYAIATFALAAVVALPATAVRAQVACADQTEAAAWTPIRAWPPPLDQRVVVNARNQTLRDALQRLADAADVQFAYSPDLLPLDRRICDLRGSMLVGDALVALLHGTGIEPIPLGGSGVALGPARTRALVPGQLPKGLANTLKPVTVTAPGSGKPTLGTISADVIDGSDLTAHNARTLAEALDGMVPGLWMWEQTPTTLIAKYGSIRGASSFGVSAPKVYIDGVEVANSLLLTQLDPQTIARVEVIRGPQGAALFGADAISGVISIVSRSGADSLTRGALFRSEAGASASAFANGAVLAQRHEFSLRTGTNARSAGLALSYGALGEFVPGTASHELSAAGDARFVNRHGSFTGSARFLATEAGRGANPLLTASTLPRERNVQSLADSLLPNLDALRARLDSLRQPQQLQQYTLNTTAILPTVGRWTPSATLGIDGYRLSHVAFAPLPTRSASDSALAAASGRADRATARLGAAAQFGADSALATTVSLTAEHSLLREATGALGPSSAGETSSDVDWIGNSGLVVRTNSRLGDTFLLTAGLRLERSDVVGAPARFDLLPMLGGAITRRLGGATVKVRSAYGKGIRPARIALQEASSVGTPQFVTRSDLPPERQSGFEVGVDVEYGTWSMSLTRFDQRAAGLIQCVPVLTSGGTDSAGFLRRVSYELQNVGEVSNRGWELQSSITAGALSVKGTYSTVDSRVVRLASGYVGDLAVGDRMLEVPTRTLGLTSTLAMGRWSSALSLARASDWVNYDGQAMAQAFVASSASLRSFNSLSLRDFWRDYSGVTRVRANTTFQLFRNFGLVLTGENLMGQQRGEPDNLTVVPGRTITFGFRARL